MHSLTLAITSLFHASGEQGYGCHALAGAVVSVLDCQLFPSEAVQAEASYSPILASQQEFDEH